MSPCPAHCHRGRIPDGDNGGDHRPPSWQRAIIVEKRPKRWIEERPRGFDMHSTVSATPWALAMTFFRKLF